MLITWLVPCGDVSFNDFRLKPATCLVCRVLELSRALKIGIKALSTENARKNCRWITRDLTALRRGSHFIFLAEDIRESNLIPTGVSKSLVLTSCGSGWLRYSSSQPWEGSWSCVLKYLLSLLAVSSIRRARSLKSVFEVTREVSAQLQR
jgi:hypothetical protein